MRRREALLEYLNASLFVLPFASGALSILVGWALATLAPGPGGWLAPLAFQGTSSEARDLLTAISGTMVTVMAVVLGLSVVALQTSSSQFSPRLLRNFLRDRQNQLVLSVFMGTFCYSAAGLYTVGVGADPEEFPRVAVSGSILLLFASLAAVVFYADHISHAIQIDSIMQRVETESLAVVGHLREDVDLVPPEPPVWAVTIPARSSGYVVTAHPYLLVPLATRHRISIALSKRVGEHIVAGMPLAQIWTPSPDDPQPDPGALAHALDDAVGIGFERTRQQDAAMGIRQLVDTACKALSPAVNDPYTAVQAVDHMAVIFAAMAQHHLGPRVVWAGEGLAIVVPSRRFGEYLLTMCGLVRRYGAGEPTVDLALIRLLDTCATLVHRDWTRLSDIAGETELLLADAEREIQQPADAVPVRRAGEALLRRIAAYRRAAE
jgi:uncharacterized membrane protein